MRFHKTNRAAYLNYLHSKYEAWSGETVVESTPYILGIDPSSICQLRCPLCPTGIENETRRIGSPVPVRNRAMLEPDTFDALMSDVGEKLFYILFYNWGEPLLNKHLPDYLRRASAHQIATEIHTNLSLRLSDEFMHELLTTGIDVIGASIDGFTQENYAKYRRGGNFELCRDNITRLAAMRDRLGLKTDIVWNFLVFSFNEHEVESARAYSQAHGMRFNQREAWVLDSEWLPSYRKEADGSPRKKAQSAPTAGQGSAVKTPAACSWHYNYSVVNADGAVSPCCAPWEQRHDFGKVQPGLVTLSDVWNNPLFQKSRAIWAGKPTAGLEDVTTLCARCPYDAEVQHLYSYLDADVEKQFFTEMAAAEPLLERAFLLLNDREKFLRFYRQHMLMRFLAKPLVNFDARSVALATS